MSMTNWDNVGPFAFRTSPPNVKIDTVDSQIFARVLFSRNFAYAKFREMKSSRNGEIIMLFTYIGKSCHSRDFFTSQICLLTLFAKIKFSRKFPNLQ